MADTVKIPKDKRHRSSSSIVAGALDDTRSERKLNMKACIPEVDDQFAIAEARCENLMEKIDLFKSLKRKKKLKKRSMTLLMEPAATVTNNPFIAVRTQPKIKVPQQPRLRRVEMNTPARGYVDPATVEQHRMIGQFRQNKGRTRDVKRIQVMQKPDQSVQDQRKLYRQDFRGARADGDAMFVQSYQRDSPTDGTYEDDDLVDYSSEDQRYDETTNQKKAVDVLPIKVLTGQRRSILKETFSKGPESKSKPNQNHNIMQRPTEKLRMQNQAINRLDSKRSEERPVVELFNKQRNTPPPAPPAPSTAQPEARSRLPRVNRMERVLESTANESDHRSAETGPLGDVNDMRKNKEGSRQPRRYKHRTRSYELPTVSSQMKQAGTRYYYETPNYSKLPFIVSKSTSPSHNIGVNLQQVLNGVKMQQPFSGIPLTIAHHMGLGHLPQYGEKCPPVVCLTLRDQGFHILPRNVEKYVDSMHMTTQEIVVFQQPMLSTREINVIKAGPQLVRLPSFKYLSYKRLLSLYREGDGMVPRFLRSISRPHYFYTSMYNLQTNREEDGTTSRGRTSMSQEAKQHLSDYAAIYKEYEHVDKCLKENYEPDLQRRKEELTKELLTREEQIRRVVNEFGSPEVDIPNLRASASIAEDTYRHLPHKMQNDS